jgi:hypothetical protein
MERLIMDMPIITHSYRNDPWYIVLERGIAWFDHRATCSLGLVSSHHDKLVCSIAPLRVQYFLKDHPYLTLTNDLGLNYYGTICAKASWSTQNDWVLSEKKQHYNSCIKKQELKLERHYFLSNVHQYATWDNFYSCLPHQPKVFFAPTGAICFHGYGNIKVADDQKSGNVMEYSLYRWGKMEQKCITEIKGQEIPLTTFLEFPSLLKAFLNSSIVDIKSDGSLFGTVKVYAIQGIKIPKDYQKCKQYFSTMTYNSFDELPEIIRKVIIMCYNSQRNSIKKIKKTLRCFG